MSHIASQKDALIRRVRKITGQLQAVERALTADADCANEFGGTVDIIQDEARFVMQPTDPAFTNLNGTITEAGLITAAGVSSLATIFECTGQFAAATFSGSCHTEFQLILIDDAGESTTVDVSIDCAFSYERD